MQGSHSGSALELVVNEQQMQNMSQVDLRPSSTDMNQQTTARLNSYLAQSAGAQQQTQSGNMFSFEELKNWPTRLRESFQSKLDEAQAKSETRTEYVIEIIQAFSGIAIWILCFVCTIIIPVILFFLGLVNLDDCADRPSLPYLVLGVGFFMTASNLFNLALAIDVPVLSNHKSLSNDVKNIIASIMNIIFNCVVALFYILCAHKVFNIKVGRYKSIESNDGTTTIDESGDSILAGQVQCDGTLYGFTYWFISLTLGAFILLIIVASLLFAYNRHRLAIIRGSTPRSQQTNSSTTDNLNNNQP